MTLLPGSRLGPYEIVSPLGAGGMGEVYRARDPRLDREVAVKVIGTHAADLSDASSRFEREARAVAAISHPNILAIHDFGHSDGVAYAAMELLEGETLRARLARAGPLPLRKSMEFAQQIAEGLAAAHEKGIIHRDLKPENIFITESDLVKILDFGLAKRESPLVPCDEGSTVAQESLPGHLLGTLSYMSPEQARCEPVDHRTDIFAFGVVLYEMLSGKNPFHGKSTADVVAAILNHDPPELDVSPRVQTIVSRCLEKGPRNRYQSARDLAFEFAALLRESASLKSGSRIGFPAMARPWKAGAVGVFLVILIAVVVLLRLDRSSQPSPGAEAIRPIRSVAVLPLENLSKQAEQEFFADGMTDALISNIARIGALRVISRTSVMRYKGSQKSLPQIARELGVDGIIEGTVLRSGGRIRITAQLIEGSTDNHLWAKTYERDLRDMLDLQSEVARDVAGEIQVSLTGKERALFAQKRAVDPAAHEDYLRGRYHWNRRTFDSMRKGLTHFQSAVEKDPLYALGYAGIADSYAMLGAYTAMAPAEAFPPARQAAEKALELDPNLAEAHATLLAVNLDYDWDWPAVEREYRRAMDINPSYVIAHQWYAMYLSAIGDHDAAVREMEVTRQLDPLSALVQTHVAMVLYHARKFDRAIEECRKVLELDPNYLPARWLMGHLYEAVGRNEDAVAERELAVKLSGRGPRYLALLARAYGFAGRFGEAEDLLQEVRRLPKTQYVSPLDTTWTYIGLGKIDKALDYLEEAYRDRSWGMYRLKVEPKADPLRAEPRFQAILHAMRFPEPSRAPK